MRHGKPILNRKSIFLVDGIGACFTTVLLGTVLANFEEYIGLPSKTLALLAIIASAYSFYSMCCYFFIQVNWRPFLVAIAVANFLYCCITIAFILTSFQTVTALGLAYFSGEILIIGVLISIEIRMILKGRS